MVEKYHLKQDKMMVQPLKRLNLDLLIKQAKNRSNNFSAKGPSPLRMRTSQSHVPSPRQSKVAQAQARAHDSKLTMWLDSLDGRNSLNVGSKVNPILPIIQEPNRARQI